MDRVGDVIIGASVLWGAAMAVASYDDDAWIRGTVVLLNVAAGLLFLFRRPSMRRASWWQSAICALSVPISLLAINLAPHPRLWPALATALFVAGGIGATLSLTTLGRSFGVLPARRRVVQRGPFSLIRHPAYACELLMILGCVLTGPSAAMILTFGVASALVVWRVQIEEDVLSTDPMYVEYAHRVRFRLVPLFW